MKTLPITGNNNIFIIDECQQLTPAAKSLLLKPCEDTGDFNYVFFCTTNPDKFFKGDKGEKVSALTTRLTQWKVEPLGRQDAMKLVDEVATKEGIDISDAVFNKIVEVGEGSPRSLLVALESVAGMGSEEEQLKILTSKVMVDSESEDAKEFCMALMGGFGKGPAPSLAKALALIKKMKTEGKEDSMSLGKMAMAWAAGLITAKNGIGEDGWVANKMAASVLQNFDKHFDTNNIDYGWHVLTLATIEAFA